MSDHTEKLRFFTLATDADGITVVTFNRPPVNAMSFEVYPELKVLADIIESTDATRVVVLTSPPDARAWCGGADLNDFLPLNFEVPAGPLSHRRGLPAAALQHQSPGDRRAQHACDRRRVRDGDLLRHPRCVRGRIFRRPGDRPRA